MQPPILRTVPIKHFGQMPGKIVFRQIEEQSGITLEDYIVTMDNIVGKKSNYDLHIQAGSGKVNYEQENPFNPLLSKRTLFSEVEAIDVILKVVDLVEECLHSREVVHSSLCPDEIFLKGRSLENLCFVGLYNCLWDSNKVLGMKSGVMGTGSVLPHDKENLSRYNLRVRNCDYVSPEQIMLG
jgi:hypothetical protein